MHDVFPCIPPVFTVLKVSTLILSCRWFYNTVLQTTAIMSLSKIQQRLIHAGRGKYAKIPDISDSKNLHFAVICSKATKQLALA